MKCLQFYQENTQNWKKGEICGHLKLTVVCSAIQKEIISLQNKRPFIYVTVNIFLKKLCTPLYFYCLEVNI